MLNRIGLGTAQLGMEYGVANTTGRPGEAEGLKILAEAVSHGVTLLDTARAYGDSEALLGAFIARNHRAAELRIVSKLTSLGGRPLTSDHFLSELRGSLRTLGAAALYAWLLHDVRDVIRDRRAFESAAARAKDLQLTEKVGISVYGHEDLDSLQDVAGIDVVQLPLSIFDQRLLRSGHVDRLMSLGVEIHARSLFLQGALLMPPMALPAHLSGLRPAAERLQAVAAERGLTTYETSLAFAYATPQIDCWIIGVETISQVKELLRCADKASEYADRAAGLAYAHLAVEDSVLVNPRTWRPA